MLKNLCTRWLKSLRRCLYVRITDVVERVQLQSIDFTKFELAEGLEVRPFDITQVDSISKKLGTDLCRDFLKRAHRSLGYILWHEKTVAGYLWASDHPRSREGARPFLYDIEPPPHTRYFYDLQVLPDCRLKGAGTALMITALKDAALSGKATVFATRASWNEPMARLFRKLGFKESGNIKLERVFGIGRRDLRALHA